MDSENKTQDTDSISGRKIFFLYPTVSVQNQIISELIQNEYEAYLAKDHSRLSYALKKYSDSIIFINIDEKMPPQEWEKWIGGILTVCPNLKIGIFSNNNEDEFREKFVQQNQVTCGYIFQKVDMTKAVTTVLDKMNELNVKGRRKYLRASTEREANATINIPYGGDFAKGMIKDISTVGFSCAFEQEVVLAKNSLVKDIQLKLQTNLLKVEAVVFGSREENGQKTFVMLFTQRVDTDVRARIRKYIQGNLQSKMDVEIN